MNNYGLTEGEIVGGQYMNPLAKRFYSDWDWTYDPNVHTHRKESFGGRAKYDSDVDDLIDQAEQQWVIDNSPELANTLNKIASTQTGFTQSKFTPQEERMLQMINQLLDNNQQFTPEMIQGIHNRKLQGVLSPIYAQQQQNYLTSQLDAENKKIFDSKFGNITKNSYQDQPLTNPKTRAQDYPNFNYFFGGR
jgi:hypothetical protein